MNNGSASAYLFAGSVVVACEVAGGLPGTLVVEPCFSISLDPDDVGDKVLTALALFRDVDLAERVRLSCGPTTIASRLGLRDMRAVGRRAEYASILRWDGQMTVASYERRGMGRVATTKMAVGPGVSEIGKAVIAAFGVG